MREPEPEPDPQLVERTATHRARARRAIAMDQAALMLRAAEDNPRRGTEIRLMSSR
jgi:hypothetical protein